MINYCQAYYYNNSNATTFLGYGKTTTKDQSNPVSATIYTLNDSASEWFNVSPEQSYIGVNSTATLQRGGTQWTVNIEISID